MKSNHYIDNAEMYRVIKDYLEECDRAEAAGLDLPRVPEYLGSCFLAIAKGLGSTHSFSAYTYLDDMKSDGVVNCIRYIRTFDPTRTKNPFAYFTTTVRNAFLQRIELETSQQHGKYRAYQDIQIMEQINGDEGACVQELNEISNNFIANRERKLAERKEKAKQKLAESKADKVSKFYEHEDETG